MSHQLRSARVRFHELGFECLADTMTADELEKIQNGLTPEATKAASTFSQKMRVGSAEIELASSNEDVRIIFEWKD